MSGRHHHAGAKQEDGNEGGVARNIIANAAAAEDIIHHGMYMCAAACAVEWRINVIGLYFVKLWREFVIRQSYVYCELRNCAIALM